MKDYYLPVLAIGVCLAVGIGYLVRRDHLYIRQGLFWIGIAGGTLLFSVWPGAIDRLGAMLGIAYPPTLLFLVAIIVLVMKALFSDIALTKIRRDVRRLNQRIALSEARAREEKAAARLTEPAAQPVRQRVAGE
jgi:hypothetical protein